MRQQERADPHYHSRFQHIPDVHQFTWCDLLQAISPYLPVSILWYLLSFVLNKQLTSHAQICYILSLIHITVSCQLSLASS